MSTSKLKENLTATRDDYALVYLSELFNIMRQDQVTFWPQKWQIESDLVDEEYLNNLTMVLDRYMHPTLTKLSKSMIRCRKGIKIRLCALDGIIYLLSEEIVYRKSMAGLVKDLEICERSAMKIKDAKRSLAELTPNEAPMYMEDLEKLANELYELESLNDEAEKETRKRYKVVQEACQKISTVRRKLLRIYCGGRISFNVARRFSYEEAMKNGGPLVRAMRYRDGMSPCYCRESQGKYAELTKMVEDCQAAYMSTFSLSEIYSTVSQILSM